MGRTTLAKQVTRTTLAKQNQNQQVHTKPKAAFLLGTGVCGGVVSVIVAVIQYVMKIASWSMGWPRKVSQKFEKI